MYKLDFMFSDNYYNNLKCILDELKYLNTKDVTSLRYCFSNVPFKDLKPIGNWDITNVKILPVYLWDVEI